MAVVLAVKATPRAFSNKIDGWTDSSRTELSVRVCAAPADGKANKTICELVAASLGIAKSRVSVKRGRTSRHKQLSIDVSQEDFDLWANSIG